MGDTYFYHKKKKIDRYQKKIELKLKNIVYNI